VDNPLELHAPWASLPRRTGGQRDVSRFRSVAWREEGSALGTVQTFDHTADVGLRVTGADLSDLFRTAAEGMFDYIVVNRDAVRDSAHERLDLTADSALELLPLWLGELLFQFETTHRLYSRFEVAVSDDGRSLSAEIAGEPIDRERHELDHEVKAVTRHGLRLEQTQEGWLADIILDI
jgi:SHS2 domain-containing protein